MSSFIHVESDSDEHRLFNPDQDNGEMEKAILNGDILLWNRQGQVGLIDNPVLCDVLRAYRGYYPSQYGELRQVEPTVPEEVGKIYWDQVQLQPPE